ncbi:MAG: GTPase ObgE [Fibrobacteres bacterium]|nr:GTPase ObgE [Fibrobacterota bacterium]
MFIDETKLEAHAGHGGKGMVSFRREKFVPLGGPSGGNGGRGGHVILVASHDIHTLYDIGNKRIFRADDGGKGEPSLCTGKNGGDIRLPVPVGTLVKDLETGDLISDLKEEGQECVVAQGGRGGIGNAAFKSSTNRAPRKSTPGDPGQSRKLQLELKLVADCGLVGFPNAGKSSLIRRLSAATPKVADYPFTTLKPVLGLVNVAPGKSYVLVDIPGLIEGAAEGKGLGHQFLRHVERCACLAYVIDTSVEDPFGQYLVLRAEMEKFHPLLLQKPKMFVLNKQDLGDFPIDPRFEAEACPILRTSAITGSGLPELKEGIRSMIGEKGIRKQGW